MKQFHFLFFSLLMLNPLRSLFHCSHSSFVKVWLQPQRAAAADRTATEAAPAQTATTVSSLLGNLLLTQQSDGPKDKHADAK